MTPLNSGFLDSNQLIWNILSLWGKTKIKALLCRSTDHGSHQPESAVITWHHLLLSRGKQMIEPKHRLNPRMNTQNKVGEATETYNQLNHVPEIRRGGILCGSFWHILTPVWQNRWSASDSQNDIMSLWLAVQRLRTVVWAVMLSAGANKDPLGENPVFVRPNLQPPPAHAEPVTHSLPPSLPS